MSLNTPYDPDNIFAKIIRGEIPNTTVYEDDDVLSFMDIFPQAEGHTLVIPKQVQATNLFDIDPATLGTLIQRTQLVARAVKEALAPDGIRIAQFNGDAAGQTVFHIHFHIIPVWTGRQERPHGSDPAESQALAALATRIKACL